MVSLFVFILNALSIQTVRVIKPAFRRNAKIPALVRVASILSVKPLITNQSVPVQLDSWVMRECSAQFQPLKVIFTSEECINTMLDIFLKIDLLNYY